MIGGKSVLAVIPARGGSKGVPKKNIRQVAGKPLIAWTIEEAKKSKYIDRLILSSDDPAIIEVAISYGCEVPFIRPAHLAQDETPGIEPVIHAVQSLPGYDYVVLLQPTSPLRTFKDIDSCIEVCSSNNKDTSVSVVEVDKNPHWMFTLDKSLRMKKVLDSGTNVSRRQDSEKFYVLNGAVYVSTTNNVIDNRCLVNEDTIAYVMEKQRSLDIDTEDDLLFFEFLKKRLEDTDN